MSDEKQSRGRFGGRAKGTPNKDTQILQEKARELGVDPFEVLLHIIKGDWKALGYDSATIIKPSGYNGETVAVERITLDQRQKAAKDACEYLYPKRKAIEVSTDPENPFEFVQVSKIDLEARKKQIKDGNEKA